MMSESQSKLLEPLKLMSSILIFTGKKQILKTNSAEVGGDGCYLKLANAISKSQNTGQSNLCWT